MISWHLIDFEPSNCESRPSSFGIRWEVRKSLLGTEERNRARIGLRLIRADDFHIYSVEMTKTLFFWIIELWSEEFTHYACQLLLLFLQRTESRLGLTVHKVEKAVPQSVEEWEKGARFPGVDERQQGNLLTSRME